MSSNTVQREEAPTPEPKHARGAQRGNRNSRKHALHTAKAALKEFGSRAIDGRTSVARSLAQWRAQIERDLGGKEALTAQQHAILDLAVKSKLLLDSVDSWLLCQDSLINRRKRSLIPALRERTQLADALARYLTMLGLERKSLTVPTLNEYLSRRAEAMNVNSEASESEQ